MTMFASLDMLARGGTIVLLALWTWLLLRDHRGRLVARAAVAMNIGIAAHAIATIPDNPFPRAFTVTADAVSVTTAASFWLFSRAWFGDERHIPATAWLGIPWLAGLTTVFYLVGGWPSPFAIGLTVLMRGSMVAFAVAALLIAWRGREGDLVETRRRLRGMLVGTVGVFVVAVVLVETLVQTGALPQVARSFAEFGVTAVTLALCAAMFGTRQPDLYGAPRRTPTEVVPVAPAGYEPLIARLRTYMEIERPYREEGLTISALAARLGDPEYRLRRAINGALGHRNFPQFLNGYRLDEVRAALADPAQREVPILTIALDAGFGSLGPFNRAFRDAEGVTPTEWRDRALADS